MPLPPPSVADNLVSPLSVSLPLVPVTAKGSFAVTVSLFVSVELLLGPVVCVVALQPLALSVIGADVRRHTRHHHHRSHRLHHHLCHPFLMLSLVAPRHGSQTQSSPWQFRGVGHTHHLFIQTLSLLGPNQPTNKVSSLTYHFFF